MRAESAEDLGVLTVASPEAALDCLGSNFLLKKALDATLLEGVDQFRFRHQLLQEYFTACALLEEKSSLSASELWPPHRWWERSGWEESVVLLAGFFEEDCGEVIRWVGEAQPEVAAQCIEQSGAEIANKDALLHEFQSAWLPRLTDIQLEPTPEARAAVGRALARLNLDNRHGVSVRQADSLPDIDWVEIEGGKFIYQQGERRMLETFRIARYPITNSQWQAFLNASDGYANDRWWEGLTNPDRQPEKSTWIESNHPVTDVSWFEAVAFCRWLTAKLGLPVRLPTEWEWERAARGRNGREYPWGDGYREGFANIHETERNAGSRFIRRTSPVGMYPQGYSEDGVCDLTGNVWEWQESPPAGDPHRRKKTQPCPRKSHGTALWRRPSRSGAGRPRPDKCWPRSITSTPPAAPRSWGPRSRGCRRRPCSGIRGAPAEQLLPPPQANDVFFGLVLGHTALQCNFNDFDRHIRDPSPCVLPHNSPGSRCAHIYMPPLTANDLAGDVTGGGRGQERDGRRDFLRPAQPAHRGHQP